MTSFFDDIRDMASEIMNGEFAVDATLSQTGGAYDPATRRKTSSSTSVACRAVMSARTIVSANGLVVSQSIATLNVKPKDGDRLQIGPSTYTITTVEEIAPDGIPVIWKAAIK